jgi:hypothetical protein
MMLPTTLQRTDRSERQRLAVPTRDINKLIDALVTLRWLDISVSEDRKQIGAAVGALLDDLAKRRCSS